MSHQNSENNLKKSFAARWGNWVLHYRLIVLISSILIVMGAGYGGQFIAFDNDYHSFFGDSNPQLQAFDALQDKYTKDDNLLIVIEPEDGNIFKSETLQALEELTKEGWQTPFSTRVDGITNYQHTRAVDDDLYVNDLVENASELSAQQIEYVKNVAINEPLLVNRLVNEKGSLTAINITVQLPGERLEENNEVVAYARDLVQRFETENPGHKTYLSGFVMLNNAFQESAEGDLSSLVPLMFLVILITILLATRSLTATFVSLVIILLSIMTGMGVAGWLGIKLTPPSAAAPTIITTLAVADSIHILITILQNMKSGMAKRLAISESLRVNFMPVFITSITTVIGFLTLNFSDTPPFHDLGNITAVGMLAAFLFSVTTLPALVSLLPLKVKATKESTSRTSSFLARLADFVVVNDKKVLWGTTFAIILVSLLAIRNDLNDEFIEYFSENVTFRQDTDYISNNLTGIYNLEYSVNSGEEGGVNNPGYLAQLSEFEDWLYEQPEVVHVNTFSEIARRINKSMHGDSLEHYTIPNNREEAAQYLLLYEMSLPFGLDLNNQINVDKSETRFTITTKNISSNEMIAFNERAETWLSENTSESMHALGTSSTLMFSNITRRQIGSMIGGTLFAILLISVILMLALKSIKYGVLSLIPNITPITVGFGVWAVTSGTINAGIAIVFGMTMGIIVDDTVHFISKFLRARREQGKSPEDAVRYAFQTVGNALVTTSIVLILGFMVLAQSDFGMNSGMALITMVIIALALIIDFLLLPTLLIMVGRIKDKQLSKKLEKLELAKNRA